MEYSWNIYKFLIEGLIITLKLWIITIGVSFPFSIIIAIARNNQIKVIGSLLDSFTNIIRGTPLMLQLYVIYFVVPSVLNIKMSAFISATIAFVVSWTAYLNEIIRVGIKSVERQQYDASKALGLNYFQTMYYVVIPQALWKSSAGIANEIVNILYNTPLIAILGMDELLKNAKVIVTRTFDFTPFIIVGLFYFLFNSLVFYGVKRIELKLTKYKKAELS